MKLLPHVARLKGYHFIVPVSKPYLCRVFHHVHTAAALYALYKLPVSSLPSTEDMMWQIILGIISLLFQWCFTMKAAYIRSIRASYSSSRVKRLQHPGVSRQVSAALRSTAASVMPISRQLAGMPISRMKSSNAATPFAAVSSTVSPLTRHTSSAMRASFSLPYGSMRR